VVLAVSVEDRSDRSSLMSPDTVYKSEGNGCWPLRLFHTTDIPRDGNSENQQFSACLNLQVSTRCLEIEQPPPKGNRKRIGPGHLLEVCLLGF